MPTYSYACTECDDRFDAVQAFSEDALTTCTKCAGRLRKLFNSVGVVFKGSGFYRTDSRESSKSGAGSKTSTTSGSSSTGGSESSSGSSGKPEKPAAGGSGDKAAPAAAAPAAATSS